MNMKKAFTWMAAGAVSAPVAGFSAQAQKPNVLLILVDDMGYGDAGFTGSKEIPTPHLDSIAANGVQFTSGYVTAPQCAPSRSGMLSGKYQNRINCEHNWQLDDDGFPRDVRMFSEYMKDAGYRTGIVGKWHLGRQEGLRPPERGFDFFFGFLGGGSVYLPQGNQKFIPNILDGYEPVQVTEYLTTVLGQQAGRFITQESDKPFFLYLSFNAPHTPMHATPEYLERFKHIQNPTRRIYAAMMAAMDDAVGHVLSELRRTGREDNTLIFFLSDNGGPTAQNASDNTPFRGVKGDILEGGARVPFLLQWKAAVPGGQVIDTPVISLDLLPTSLAAAGVPVPKEADLDGVNLLPLARDGQPLAERSLYWRFPHPPANPVWGIRRGEWKLVKEAVREGGIGRFDGTEKTGLYRITDDIREENDLSQQYPEVLQKMQSAYDAWNASLPAVQRKPR
jgi:arylsulfatase A-like enzyme